MAHPAIPREVIGGRWGVGAAEVPKFENRNSKNGYGQTSRGRARCVGGDNDSRRMLPWLIVRRGSRGEEPGDGRQPSQKSWEPEAARGHPNAD